MIVSSLTDFNDEMLKLLSNAMRCLKEYDLENIEAKTYVLDGDDLIMHVQEYITKDENEIRFENHDNHLDLHYIVSGQETICISRDTGDVLEQNSMDDIKFYDPNLKVYNKVHLQKGDFLLTAPRELHKPRCNYEKNEKVRKVVLKIKL